MLGLAHYKMGEEKRKSVYYRGREPALVWGKGTMVNLETLPILEQILRIYGVLARKDLRSIFSPDRPPHSPEEIIEELVDFKENTVEVCEKMSEELEAWKACDKAARVDVIFTGEHFEAIKGTRINDLMEEIQRIYGALREEYLVNLVPFSLEVIIKELVDFNKYIDDLCSQMSQELEAR